MTDAITLAGLQDVAALKATAGLTAPLQYSVGTDTLPPGVVLAKDPNGNGKGPLNTLKFTGPVALHDWDLTGYGVAVNASVPVSFANCKFASPTDPAPNRSLYWIALGQLGVCSPVVSFADCDLDFTSYANGNTINHNAGTLSFENCRFENGSQDYVIASRGQSCRVNRCYMGPFGINSLAQDHLEAIHWFQGDCAVTNTFIDCRDGAGKIVGGVTGLLFPAATADLDLVIDRCILLGAPVIKSIFTLQARTGAGRLNMAVTNSVLEKGESQYLGKNPGAGALNVFQNNNRDFATGARITI